jgi:hypothetical protein
MKKSIMTVLTIMLCVALLALTACKVIVKEDAETQKKGPLIERFNESKQILILGNSFVGTSQVGDFLNDMLSQANSDYRVKAISRGFATVETYASDPEIMKEIEDGRYCCVFQCGFYYESEIEHYKTIKNACRKSGTAIMAFPAHNEIKEVVRKLSETEDCLDWQEEIEALMRANVSHNATLWDFCIMDEFRHSTPLAGYVGAHMIYRRIFGEVPPSLSDNAPLTMEYIKEQLTHYPETGVIGPLNAPE